MNILIRPFTIGELTTPITFGQDSLVATIYVQRLKANYNFTYEAAKDLVTDCCLNTLPLSIPLAPLMESNPELFI